MTERRLSDGLGIKGEKERDRQTAKELEETFEDDRYVHYLDHDDGSMRENICQVVSDRIFKVSIYTDNCMVNIP